MPDLTVMDQTALRVLIAHQRLDIGSCICGWGVDTGHLGQSHALHVWRELQAALPTLAGPGADCTPEGGAR